MSNDLRNYLISVPFPTYPQIKSHRWKNGVTDVKIKLYTRKDDIPDFRLTEYFYLVPEISKLQLPNL